MTRENSMTLADFQALLDTHGADAARWPAADRPWAEALATTSAAARAALAEARALDALLSEATVTPPRAGLLGDIMDALPPEALAAPVRTVTRMPERRTWFRSIWTQAIGYAAAAGLGLSVGLVEAAATDAQSEPDIFTLAADYGSAFGLTIDDSSDGEAQ